MASICQRDTHMPMFIAALFSLSNHEINIRDAYQLINGLKNVLYTVNYYLAIKMEKKLL